MELQVLNLASNRKQWRSNPSIFFTGSAGSTQLATTMLLDETKNLLTQGLQYPVEVWHSHPDITGYGSNILSPADIINANQYNLNSYLHSEWKCPQL